MSKRRFPRKGDKITLLDADKKPIKEITVTDGRKAIIFPEWTRGVQKACYVGLFGKDVNIIAPLTREFYLTTGEQAMFSVGSLVISESEV